VADYFSSRPAAARAAENALRARLRREVEAVALRRLAPEWDAAAWKETPREERGTDADWREIAAAAEAATAKPL
jgi:hypothetical protein